ncbi:DUF2007 domain-containing protein [Permianibacter sp. IMCC34836]|nr:DUF2007 domain-containing protein [Permianibacter fluminis]
MTTAEVEESAVAGDLVPIARYLEPAEATVLQAVLDSEGIPAFSPDAHMATANYLLSTATGGVRILVPESHLQAAHEILEAIRRGDYALSDDEDIST